MRREARCDWRNMIPEAWNHEGGSAIDRMCSMDRQVYIPEDLMVKVDRTSMHVSLEVRAPLLDHKLFELARGCPCGCGSTAGWANCPSGEPGPAPGKRVRRAAQARVLRAAGAVVSPRAAGPLRDAVLRRRDRRLAVSRPGRAAIARRARARIAGPEPRLWKLLMLDAWERKFQEAAALRPAGPLQAPRAA